MMMIRLILEGIWREKKILLDWDPRRLSLLCSLILNLIANARCAKVAVWAPLLSGLCRQMVAL